jgi:PAS domain S-box-containing protein
MSTLRERAEERAAAQQNRDLIPQSPAEAAQLIEELRVHQIELEMQNEELRRAQEELEAARARYFDLYDLAPVGYLTLSEKGLILEGNLTAAMLLGVARGALVKQRLAQFILPADQDIFYRHRKALFETGEPQVYELRMIRPATAGGAFWARLEAARVAPAPGETGGPTGRVTISDITTLKQVEDKLHETLADLQRSNADLEQFASIASHDLQEPLRMVTSYMQLLKMRYAGQLDADADDFIGFAVDGATRMQQLILDLLEYARVGTRGEPPQPTDATAVCQAVIKDLEIAITDAGATIVCDPLPTVLADPWQLHQLFQNLIGNAIKFRGAEPPVVHVSVCAKDDGESTMDDGRSTMDDAHRTSNIAHRTSGWVFSVRDNGIGMEPRFFERIFVIFQRLHNRSEYPGTGIGLAVCKKIVERHGGRIWVESAPGQGTTFYFTLPAADPQHSS